MCAPVHWAAGSDREMNFGVTADAAPKAASSTGLVLDLLRLPFVARDRALLVRVRGNQAGVDGESIGSDQPFGHAALNDGLEQMTKDIALAKAPMPVLGKGRMVRDLVIQTEAAKPAIGEIEMNLLAQSALRAYAHAIAGDQHADHQLRIDRGATGAAVEPLQRLTNVIEVEMPIDASQNVIGRDMVVEAEIIE